MTENNTPPPRRDNGLYFVLGAIVVALGVLVWYVMGSPGDTTTPAPAGNEVSITNEAPASEPAQEPASDAPAEVEVAPGADDAPAPQQ
ncbi:hypothetical protein [Thioclava sp. GXIMD2076]|uniref:Dynamin n=1 Tax=Thioclava kandeliae TaxID=3070818 RepID=A0ABV1SGC1_9RHOB